jgi:hypothetical protein
MNIIANIDDRHAIIALLFVKNILKLIFLWFGLSVLALLLRLSSFIADELNLLGIQKSCMIKGIVTIRAVI